MSAYTLGENCHIILRHAAVNGGAPYGFVSPKDGSIREQGVQFIREVNSDSIDFTDTHAGTRLWVHFDVICADGLINPDGSRHETSREEDYAMLMAYFSMPNGIQCITAVGALNNLGSLGWSCDERHYPAHSVLRCQLNNVGYYFPPAPPEKIALSIWDGTLPWDTCYWV